MFNRPPATRCALGALTAAAPAARARRGEAANGLSQSPWAYRDTGTNAFAGGAASQPATNQHLGRVVRART